MLNSEWIATLPNDRKEDIILEHIVEQSILRIDWKTSYSDWLNSEYVPQESDGIYTVKV